MAGTAPNVSNDEYRMFLQLDTSLLVWLRTSLALMGFGFVIARFGLFLREIAQADQLIVHPHSWLTRVNTFTGTARSSPTSPQPPVP